MPRPRARSRCGRGSTRAAACAPARAPRRPPRMGMAERRDGETAEEVEVALAVRRPKARALAADEGDLPRRVRRHQRHEPTDHRADAFGREDLEQQHARHAPVEDVGDADTGPHRFDAAADLGDHPFTDDAVGDQLLGLGGGERRDARRRVVDVAADALDVGEVDELLGAERFGDRGGGGVGVDVVGLTVVVDPDRRDDGDQLLARAGLRASQC